jgi:hypothetical protein
MSQVQAVDLNIRTSKEYIQKDLLTDKAGGSSLAYIGNEESSGK